MGKLYDSLNVDQKLAVEFITQPVLVIAGAGSGKTSVITAKVAYLLSQGYDIRRMFLSTFTRKAAYEIINRVSAELGYPIAIDKCPFIGTLHSIGYRIISDNWKTVNLKAKPSVMLESQRFKLIKEIANAHIIRPLYKNLLLNISEDISKRKCKFGIPNSEYDPIFKDYRDYCFNHNLIDYDDMISMSVSVLKSDKIRDKYVSRIDYVMIDEFQDIDELQYTFIKYLVPNKNNITVVGDDDQAIYTFRGSIPNIFHRFDKDFDNTKIIILNRNYRSGANILNLANRSIKNNSNRYAKELIAATNNSDKVAYIKANNVEGQANLIAANIVKLRKAFPGKTCAVLYRNNLIGLPIEKSLRLYSIPYINSNSFNFFDQVEVRICHNLIRLLLNMDVTYFYEMLKLLDHKYIDTNTINILYNTGVKSLDELNVYIESGLKIKPEALIYIQTLMEPIFKFRRKYKHYEDIAANFGLLLESAGIHNCLKKFSNDFERSVTIENFISDLKNYETYEEFYKYYRSIVLSDDPNYDINPVRLSTVHSAKGLEYDFVFFASLSRGMLPMSGKNSIDIEEERRLFYVGCTRAKSLLVLCTYKDPSLFLVELDII